MKLIDSYSSEEEDKEEEQTQGIKTEKPSFEKFIESKLNQKKTENISNSRKRCNSESIRKSGSGNISSLLQVPKPPQALFNKFSKKPCTGLTEDNKRLDAFFYNKDSMNFIRQAHSVELYFYIDVSLDTKVRQKLRSLTRNFNTAFDKHDVFLTENKLNFYKNRMANNVKTKEFPNDSWFYKMYHSDFVQKTKSYRIGNPESFMKKDVHTALRTYNKTLKGFANNSNKHKVSTLGIQFIEDQPTINPLFINKYGLDESLHVSISTGASLEDISAKTHGKEIDACQNSLKKDIGQLRGFIKKEMLNNIPESFKQRALSGDWEIKLEPQIVMYPNMYFTKIYFAFKVSEQSYDLFQGIRDLIKQQPLFEKTASFINLDNLHVSAWVLDLPFPKLDMNGVFSESLYEIVQEINIQLKNSSGIGCDVSNFKLKRESGDIQTFYFR